tara:strand:+ start:301 stop:579 length:279 start_codon:yes stop_codon:yes gene_type:complete
MTIDETLVDFAASVISTLENRGSQYGDVTTNHRRIAQQWSATMKQRVTAPEAALMMVQVKIARLIQTPDHEDSIHDLVGYAFLYWKMIHGKK